MPAITRSRLAIIVVTLTLLSFLWTFGLPRDLPTPSLPALHHDAPPVEKPAAVTGARPYVHPPPPPPPAPPKEEEKKPEPPKEKEPEETPTPTPPPAPEATQSQEVTLGEEERPEKEDGNKEGEQAHSTTTVNAPVNATASAAPAEETNPCKRIHGAADVMIIVKTSKAELDNKLPAHVETLLSCVPNFAIFSDHSGDIGGHKIYDALEDIGADTRKNHKEFDDYQKNVENPDDKVTEVNKELDKWKILPMVYKAHKLRPYAKFYFFIEADTSLSWTNALQWTDRLDYRIPYYSGAPSFLGSVKFAQRGSGIMLSYGAMVQYSKAYEERYTTEWEARVGRECCGDMVLATALTESHVEFYSSFPLIQGETPSTLDWTEKNWCAPVVTWHHMAVEDINSIWGHHKKWTEANGWEVPYLFRDAFKDSVEQHMAEQKEEWDNIGSDTKIVKGVPPKEEDKPKEGEDGKKEEKKDRRDEEEEASNKGDVIIDAAESVTTCRDLCVKTEDCIQWRYLAKEKDSECHLSKTIRLGKAAKKTGDETWTSGWMLEKIMKLREGWDKCEKIKWGFNQ